MVRGKKLKKMTQADVNQKIGEQQTGLQLVFKNCDLSGIDLSDRNFESINFEDCDLSGVNFSGTIIKRGEFKNGLLIGGNFEKADLSGVDFNGCAMQKINLSNVRIEGVGIKASNLAHASLKSVTIEFSDQNVFKDVNLADADLSESNISWLIGENINFKNANFKNSAIYESQLKNSKFTDASLENAELYSVIFTDCEMKKSILAKAKITNVTFEKSALENADFKQSEIAYGNFVDSNLNGVDFKGVELSSQNAFRNVSIVGTDFSETTFSEESKFYDVNSVDAKGLDVSRCEETVPVQNSVEVEVPELTESSALREYQYHLNLFVAQNVGSEVNAEADCKIAQTMLEQGYSSEFIEAAITKYSPNPLKVVSRTYAMNVVRKAKKGNNRR